MTTRTTRFQIEFTSDGTGNVKAEIAGVGKAVEDSGKKAATAATNWESAGEKIGSAMRWAGVAVAAGVAIVLRNTAKASQEIPQLEAVLRSTGNTAIETRDSLLQLADQLADRSTFSTGQIVEAETRLLSYSGILGENIPRAMQAVIDQGARLGISLSQSSEIIGRALESPSKAAAALSQQGFGAAFTKEVREQIKALEQAGKAGEAQRVILDILEESYGGAAEAARNTFGGALAALGKELEDLTTGDAGSLPAATEGVNDLVELLGSPETQAAFDTMTSGVITLTGGMAELVVKLAEVRQAFKDTDEQSVDFLNKRADAISREINAIKDDETGVWGIRSALGFDNDVVLNDYRRQLAEIEAQIRSRAPRVTLIDNGQALPNSVLNPVVSTNGGGGTPDPDEDAERRAARIARAFDAARGIQADWHRELESQGSPILDQYAERLGKIEEQAQAMARAKVPTDQIEAYRVEMQSLAASLRDKGLAEYQREFAEETAALAAAQGGPGVESAQRYEQAMEDLRKQQERGLITAEMAADRERAYAADRDQAATDVLRAIEDERAALGLMVPDLEVYNNLKQAGVEANSELGQSIVVLTRQLQAEREATGAVNDTADALHQLGSDVLTNLDDAGDAVERFGERLQRMAADLLMDKALQWLFSVLTGGGAGAYTGNGTGSGSLMGFGNNMAAFMGTGRATGGGVSGSGIYPVTEMGRPELLRRGNETWLIPGRDGVVMPARDAAAGGAGGGAGGLQVVVNNHAGANVATREERQPMPDGSVLRRLIVDVVGDSLANGQLGQLGRAQYGWRPAV